MNIKKYWMMLAIALVSLCTISCGGDDNDENMFSAEDKEAGTTAESTAYLATEQVKTITLRPISSQAVHGNAVNSEEYLVYKDYYYKYTLCLSDAYIYVKPYRNGGTGWERYYSWDYYDNISCIYDVGDVTDITQIEEISLYYDDYFGYGHPKKIIHENCQFKPGHGYVIGYLTGADKDIKQMRVFPTKYTLDNNDVLTSVTIEYQLF